MEYITALSLLPRNERGAIIRHYLDGVFNGNSYAVATAFNVGATTAYKWLKGLSVPAGENLDAFELILEEEVVDKPVEFYTNKERESGEHIRYYLLPREKAIKDDYCVIYDKSYMVAREIQKRLNKRV